MILGHRLSPKNNTGGNVGSVAMPVIKQEKIGNFELYNLASDPYQEIDVKKDHPKIFSDLLSQILERHRQVQVEGPRWQLEP